MFIAANLGVLDEADLISACVEHLRRIGVDLIVAGDMGSTDGTREQLSAFEKDGNVFVVDLRDDEDILGFHQRVFAYTKSTFPADRILSLDADEFWIPMSGKIKATEYLDQYQELRADRFNVPIVEGKLRADFPITASNHDATMIVAQPVRNARQEFLSNPNLKHILTHVMPKAMVCPKVAEGFIMGGHGIRSVTGADVKSIVPTDLIVVHVPFSSRERFEHKIENIRRSLGVFGHRLSPGMAWQWRRWLQIADANQIDEEYDRQSLSPAEYTSLLADGSISSIRDYFARNRVGEF
jgi:hypothetical protein